MAHTIVKRADISMIIIDQSDEIIRIIETSWKNVYSVIYEDAYQSAECGHKFMTSNEIEKKYNINIERLFSLQRS